MLLPWIMFTIGLNAFNAAYFLSFPTVKCGAKDGVTKKDIFYYWFFFVAILSSINFITNFSFISLYLFPVLILFYVKFFIQGSFVQKALWSILPIIVMAIIEPSIAYFFAYLTGVSFLSILTPNMFHVQITLVGKIFDLAFCLLVLRMQDMKGIGFKRSFLFITVNMLCLTMIAILFLTRNLGDIYFRSFILLIASIIFLINMGSFIVQITDEVKNRQKLNRQHEEELAGLRKELETNYYLDLLSVYGTYSRYRENLVMLFSKTAWGKRTDSKEIDAFIAANRNLIADHQTGINLIDITLLVLKFNAANHGVTVNVLTDLVKETIIDPYDVSVIIHSLVSQGIEILRTIRSDPDLMEIIEVKLTTNHEYFELRIEYPINGEIQYTFLDRDKIKPRESIIRDIIKWHQGSVSLKDHDYYLSIIVHLPLPVTGRHSTAKNKSTSEASTP